MKKKFLTMLLAVVGVFCLCFGLAACGEEPVGSQGGNTQIEQPGGDTPSGDEPSGEEQDEQPGGEEEGGSQSGGSQTPSVTEYIVTYDANGGAFAGGGTTFTQTVEEGTKLIAPTSPARSNYTFAGWGKSRIGSAMWKFDEDTVSENTTLYAQWTQESAVILSVEGASIDGREIFMLVDHTTGEVSLSSKVVCSDDSIWRLYSDPEGQREIPTKMVTNLRNGENTYYIVVNSQNQARVNVYELTVHRSYLVTVSYYNGDNILKTEEVYTGDTFTASYTPNITGYTFNKWKTLGGKEFTSDVIWGTTTLYADKTANDYKVTLDVNGGDALTETEKTLTYDEAYSFPVPRRTGYTFVGWYVGSTQITNVNGSSLSAWGYASAQNVTAHWQANEYAVTLKRNDENAGTVSGGGNHAYDSNVTIKATTKSGYNFLGWFDKGDNLVSENATYTFKMEFDTTYTAKWDFYTVTVSCGDSTAGMISQNYNEEKISVDERVSITATTNRGYTFLGWYSGDDELTADETLSFTMKRENVDCEARWKVSPEMEGFIFTSTPTTCMISGVKDKTVTEIVVPEYVTGIRGGAFYGCSRVESIVVPFVGESRKTASNTYQYPFGFIFGTSSFSGASAVRQCYYGSSTSSSTFSTYYIPNSLKDVTITGGEILFRAFDDCSGLMSVTIGNGVTSIRSQAFYSCDRLESVIWNAESCTTTGSSDYPIFMGCTNLKTVTFGENVKNIPAYALSGCSGLTSITIPDSVTSIGREAFKNTAYYNDPSKWDSSNVLYIGNHLIEAKNTISGSYTIRTGVKTIADYAFYNCDGLTSVASGNNVTSIGDWAFYECSGLTSITIPDSVTSIGEHAFGGCDGLTSITIPDSVTSIGRYAFSGCTGLESVIWNAENCENAGNSSNPIFGSDTNLKTVTFGENVKKIPASAFSSCSKLTSITIPDSVTSIGDYAFSGCRGLTSVTIPDSVTSIGEDAFSGCTGLTEVHITDLAAWCRIDFGSYAANPLCYAHHLYLDGNEIKDLIIPNEITEIKNYAFYGYDGLTSIDIHNGVTSIGNWAFYDCNGLTSVTIGSGVTSVGRSAFVSCDRLQTVYYEGTPSDWLSIQNSVNGTANATIYFFSAQTPSEEQWEESWCWWHYEADGETIVLWKRDA